VSEPLSVVCWRWGTRYSVNFVNRLAAMLSRHLHLPYRFFCITDDPAGLDPGISPIAIWPANGLGRARRLRIFDPSLRELFGSRILQLDIDCILTADVTALVDRPEPLVMCRTPPEHKHVIREGKPALKPNPDNGEGPYNTSMLLMDTGVLPDVWADYLHHPHALETQATKAGLWTVIYTVPAMVARPLAPGDDDQAVISLYARVLNPPVWGEQDGVYKWGRRGFADRARLPENAKIVFCNASMRPFMLTEDVREQFTWLREHWR